MKGSFLSFQKASSQFLKQLIDGAITMWSSVPLLHHSVCEKISAWFGSFSCSGQLAFMSSVPSIFRVWDGEVLVCPCAILKSDHITPEPSVFEGRVSEPYQLLVD